MIASLSHGTAKKEERKRGGEGKDDGLHYEFQRGNPHIQQSLTSAHSFFLLPIFLILLLKEG